MQVPIRNLYYLLCYAWDRLEARELVDTSTLTGRRPEELFARVLADGTAHLLRRGMDRAYDVRDEETARPRGKIDLSTTLKRALHLRGRAQCGFDELTHDVLHNRILKATIRRLLAADLAPRMRDPLWRLLPRLHDVSEIDPTRRDFHRVRIHRNNAHYRFLLNVCELVCRRLLVDQQTGRSRFLEFSAARGNDLMTPRPEMDFPGLKPGDRWCLCAARWKEAVDAGAAPPVVLESTHERALTVVSLDELRAHSVGG